MTHMNMTPQEIVGELDKHVVGQGKAKPLTKPTFGSVSLDMAKASGIISNRSLTAIFRRLRVPSPSVMQDLSIEEWTCSLV